MAAAGADHVTDIQQLLPDGFQFSYVLDLEADGEEASAVGQILAVQFLHTDTGGGHNGGDVQQQAVTGDAVQLQGGLEGLLLFGGPADTNPAGGLAGIIPVGSVGAVSPVDGNTEALGDKAGNGITGDGGAALGDEETVTELRAATAAQLVEADGFKKTDSTDGWKLNESSTVALPEVLLCQLDGHTYETKQFAATCVAEGYTAHVCADCGFSYSFDKISKLDHVESGEWIIDKEPTVLSFGGKHMEIGRAHV